MHEDVPPTGARLPAGEAGVIHGHGPAPLLAPQFLVWAPGRVEGRRLVVARLAAVDGNDVLIDLGSGDGRIVVTAARAFGIRGIGFDIDPQRVAEARVNAREAGVQQLAEFRQENIFTADFSKATVVTMYLLTAVNLRLRPKLLAELKPGTRVVSHDFHMDDWEPDRRLVVGKTLYLWIIPSRVEGTWRVDAGDRRFDLVLRQHFQKLEGSAAIASRTARLWEGRLDGERIGFTLSYVPGGDAASIEHDDAERAHRFDGRVEGWFDAWLGLLTIGGTSLEATLTAPEGSDTVINMV